MKSTVKPAWSLPVIILLITAVTGCSSSSPRPDSQPVPPPQPVVDTEPSTAESDTAAQKRSTIQVKKQSPRKYIVKKGDTLWDIASLYLKDPWFWPEIWHKNQQVKNPHLIFPGDVLTLVYVDGQPRVMVEDTVRKETGETVEPAQPGMRVVKLSPSIRRDSLEAAIPTIPGDAIRQFTTKPRVVTKKELELAPYILSSDDEHLILGQGNRIYVRGELDKERVRYTVFRPGGELVDPDTDEVLGYEAIYAGEAHIEKYGDPALGVLTRTEREVLIGDRLLPMDKSKISNIYFPKLPDGDINGKIISLFDALFGIAKFQVAVINLGARDGLEVGHLLATYTAGERIRDRYDPHKRGLIKMPDERSGLMMVFRTFDQVSYGLIMESTKVIRNHDIVATPR